MTLSPRSGFSDCPECGGSGEVTWNPSWRRDPQCERTAKCHLCGGAGAIDRHMARLARLQERRATQALHPRGQLIPLPLTDKKEAATDSSGPASVTHEEHLMDSPTVPPIHHLHPRRATLADWERDVPTHATQVRGEEARVEALAASMPPPSARSVLRHGTEAAQLAHALAGELEWLNRHAGPLGDRLGEDVCRALIDVDRLQSVLDRVRGAAMRGVRS